MLHWGPTSTLSAYSLLQILGIDVHVVTTWQLTWKSSESITVWGPHALNCCAEATNGQSIWETRRQCGSRETIGVTNHKDARRVYFGGKNIFIHCLRRFPLPSRICRFMECSVPREALGNTAWKTPTGHSIRTTLCLFLWLSDVTERFKTAHGMRQCNSTPIFEFGSMRLAYATSTNMLR